MVEIVDLLIRSWTWNMLEIPPAQRTNYPKNRWYVAAARDELTDGLLGRELLGEKIVLYRRDDGEPVALSDWCPHRGFSLSQSPSRRLGDFIQCGYHGLEFNSDGICTRVPAQNRPPPQMRVQRFPLRESGLWVWIWIGDPEKAGEAPVPTIPFSTQNMKGSYLYNLTMAANFQMLNENLLDFTHATFLHPGFADNMANDLANEAPQFEVNGDLLKVYRIFEHYVPEPAVAQIYGIVAGQPVWRSLTQILHPPGYWTMGETYRSLEDPSRVITEQVGESPVTPTSDNALINWVAMHATRTLDPSFADASRATVGQDKAALEIAQAYYDSGRFAEVSLIQDRPAFHARRVIAEMVAAEVG